MRWKETSEHSIDLVIIERAEIEADKTVTRLCETCRQGWIQRLEDDVKPFLTSMITGVPTSLPPARRELLARWAATTAIVLECASDPSLPTPRFAREYLRTTGVHPGTQVLVGRYDGRLEMLTAERDLFVRTVSGEQRHLSQTSLIMGNVLIQVFADPWRDTPPELTDSAAQPFIALVGSDEAAIEWPPDLSIDDELYDLVRLGSGPETWATEQRGEVPEGRETIMANHRSSEQIDSQPAMSDRDADGWTSVLQSLDVPPEATDDTPTGAQRSAAPVTVSPPETFEQPPELPNFAWAAHTNDETANKPTRRWPRRLAVSALVLFVVVGLAGFGLHERSNADSARARSTTLLRRTQALDAQIRVKALQVNATQSTVTALENRIAALTADKKPPADESAELRQLVSAVPAATDGLRQCANAALQTALNALNFAAAYPDKSTGVDAAATNVASVCGRAGVDANALDELADRAHR
ncbi:MAG: hypothetical protein ACLPVY_08745 [Acidimicrobiia bacterium]